MSNYILVLNNGSDYKISEGMKQKILDYPETKLFELPNGCIINIAYMVEIKKIEALASYKLQNKVI